MGEGGWMVGEEKCVKLMLLYSTFMVPLPCWFEGNIYKRSVVLVFRHCTSATSFQNLCLCKEMPGIHLSYL